MHVFEAWLVYLIVVAVVWVLLSGVAAFSNMSNAAKLFWALLAGALVVFFMMHNIEGRCGDDRFWLCLLLLIAFITPIIIGLWLLWNTWNKNGGWDLLGGVCNEGKVDNTYVCEGDDCVHVMSRVHSRTGDTIVYHQ